MVSNGWVKTTVEDSSISIQYGLTSHSSMDYKGARYLRITDIQNRGVCWKKVPFCEETENLEKYYLNEGDIVFARTGATVGKSFLIKQLEEKAVFASYLIRVVVNKDIILPEFLAYYFQTPMYWSAISKKQRGIGQPNVNGKILGKLDLSMPEDVSQQKQIVDAIDTQVTKIDASVKALQSVKKKLELYRKSVLNAVFDGKQTIRLEELTSLITKGASPKWQGISYTDGSTGILFVTSENVRSGYIDMSKEKFVESKFNQKQKRSILRKGDVLLNIVGASIGRAAIYDNDTEANINQAVAVIRLSDLGYNDYICYFLNSSIAQRYYNIQKVDVARANLSLKDVGNIPIPICDDSEMKGVLSEIESRFSVIDKIEETVNHSLVKAERLRKSILKSAFEGKLVKEGVCA